MIDRLLKRINRFAHAVQINWSKIMDSRDLREPNAQAVGSR